MIQLTNKNYLSTHSLVVMGIGWCPKLAVTYIWASRDVEMTSRANIWDSLVHRVEYNALDHQPQIVSNWGVTEPAAYVCEIYGKQLRDTVARIEYLLLIRVKRVKTQRSYLLPILELIA